MCDVISKFCHYQDVGEGWWEAKNERGQSGLVPESYLEVRVHKYVYSRMTCCTGYQVFLATTLA